MGYYKVTYRDLGNRLTYETECYSINSVMNMYNEKGIEVLDYKWID